MTDDQHDPSSVDWEQFAPLYDAHERRLYRLALLLHNGDEAVAEEAVANTFVSAYQAWATDRVGDDVLGYARRALVTDVLERGRGGRPPLGDRDAGGSAFRMLARLAVAERTAIVLRYYEDLPYGQIADAMNVPAATAQAYVSAGLQHLREPG